MSVFTINHSSIATFGVGASEQVGQIAKQLGCTRVLFICDPVMVQLGHSAKIEENLKNAGVEVSLYSEINGEPTFDTMDVAGAAARAFRADGVVALGGGSSMDTAKAVGLMLKAPGSTTSDFSGMNAVKPHDVSCPVILMPTTAGTSSEVTFGFAVTDPKLNVKTGGLKTGNRALVDPMYTMNLPAKLTAQTSMDMLAHVTESITNPAEDWMADMISEKVIGLVFKYLPIAIEKGDDLEARTQLSYACLIAGYAFSNKGTHLGHTVADAISSAYHYPHGVGCCAGLRVTLRYAAKKCPEKLAVIAKAIGLEDTSPQAVMDAYTDLIAKAGMKTLKELEVEQGVIDRLTAGIPTSPRFGPRTGLDAQAAVEALIEEFNA